MKLKVLILVFWLGICGCASDERAHVIGINYIQYIALNKTHQFSAWGQYVYLQYRSISPRWSVAGDVGTISSSGLFTPTREGKGTVTAEYQGLTATLPFEVTSKGYVAGTLKDTSGFDVDGMIMSITEVAGSDTTSYSGLFSTSLVPPGKYTLLVQPSGSHLGTSAAVSVDSGIRTELSLVVSPRFTVSSEIYNKNSFGKIESVNGSITNVGGSDVKGIRINYKMEWYASYATGESTSSPSSLAAGGQAVFQVPLTPSFKPPLELDPPSPRHRLVSAESF